MHDLSSSIFSPVWCPYGVTLAKDWEQMYKEASFLCVKYSSQRCEQMRIQAYLVKDKELSLLA